MKVSVSNLRGFKAKVALEAEAGSNTLNEIGKTHGVHPKQVALWKKALQTQAVSLPLKNTAP